VHAQILKKLCSDYVVANIDRENALWMLERVRLSGCAVACAASLTQPRERQAMLYNAEEVIATCVNVIARNFSYIYNANYNILPYR
jgi:hypothetical protein